MSSFTPRLTAPSASDLRWIQANSGGYNLCIYGSDGPPSVLPNCTGYVHGRLMEIRGVNTDDCGLSFGNGADYWSGSAANWPRSSEPTLGAVVCYYTNTAQDGQPGHVGVVEQIIDSNTIVVSESNWNDVRWRLVTCYRQYGWRPSSGWNVSPQGFLTNPFVDDQPPVGELSAAVLLLLMKYNQRKEALHGKRVARAL